MAGSLKKLKASLRPMMDNETIRKYTLEPFAGLPYRLNPLSIPIDNLIYGRKDPEDQYEDEEEYERS